MAKLFKKKINLGKKRETTVCESPKTSKDKVYYPTVYISDKKLPIEPEDVGKMLSAIVRLKITGVNVRTSEDKQSLNYDFEIREIAFDNEEIE